MSGIFQGYTNSNGRVRASQVTEVPAGSANDRGMIVAGNRVIPYQIDAGQPRTFHDGIAFDNVTGMLLAATTPFGQTNISMGGLLVDSRGAVMLTDGNPQVIHQGVGLQNNGRLSIESEPIATFIAHLSNNVASTAGPGTFTRASDGLYLGADGNWRVAPANEPRFENDQLLMEPAITNKCTNYNANPDAALSNVTTFGAAEGVLSRADDSLALSSAGLLNVCSSGFAFDVDNSGGGSNFGVIVSGVAGNINSHLVSAFARQLAGGTPAFIRLGSSGPTQNITSSTYSRVATASAAAGTGDSFYLVCPAGAVVRFVLNQLEESAVVTSPIITLGAAGQRAIDALEWAGLSSFFDTAEGTMLCDFQPLFSIDNQSPSQRQGIVSVRGTQPDILYQQRSPATEYRIVSTNQDRFPLVLLTPDPPPGSSIRCAVRWSTLGSEMQIGAFYNGSWIWSTPNLYGVVVYPTGTVLEIAGTDLNLPMRVSNLVIYDRALSTAEIEAL